MGREKKLKITEQPPVEVQTAPVWYPMLKVLMPGGWEFLFDGSEPNGFKIRAYRSSLYGSSEHVYFKSEQDVEDLAKSCLEFLARVRGLKPMAQKPE